MDIRNLKPALLTLLALCRLTANGEAVSIYANGNTDVDVVACPRVSIYAKPCLKSVFGDPRTKLNIPSGEGLDVLFKSETVTTNAEYQYLLNKDNSHDSGFSCITNPVILISMHERKKVVLAKFLAYEFLYRVARVEYEKMRRRRLPFIPFWRFPNPIPVDFKFSGYRCSEYDLKMIPFVVASDTIGGSLEEVLCKFSISGEFFFALYINLNDLTVSPDFIAGSKCQDLLLQLGRFPFLCYKEACKQAKMVGKLRLDRAGLESSGGCTTHGDDVIVDVDE